VSDENVAFAFAHGEKKLTYRTEEIARLTVLAEEIATFLHSDRRRQLATILAE
jgi:hypothetical protein